jgi:hypothetical protein
MAVHNERPAGADVGELLLGLVTIQIGLGYGLISKLPAQLVNAVVDVGVTFVETHDHPCD